MGLEYPQNTTNLSSPILALRAPIWRSKLVVAVFALAFAGLSARSVFVMTMANSPLQARVVKHAMSKDTLSVIAVEIERLNQLATRTDTLTISELQLALKRSVEIASLAAVDLELQAKTWKEIEEKIAKDKTDHQSLKADIAEIKKLHALEIERVKSVIDAAAQPSEWAVFINHFVSFAFGVASSLVASWIYDLRKREIKNAREPIGKDQDALD